MRVLLVEDNQFLAGNIGDFMALHAVTIDYAQNAKQCLSLVKDNEYDVIVLDVMMPGADGFETCQRLRQELLCQVPIIFLTAKVELEHKLQGFEAGGDDYLTKPFEMEELLVRLKALVMRGLRADSGKLVFVDLELDLHTRQVTRAGGRIKVNQVQYCVLRELMKQAPGVVSRQQLEYAIWGEDVPDSDVLRTHIYRLRNLLDKPFDIAYLETVHGQGFRLKEPAD